MLNKLDLKRIRKALPKDGYQLVAKKLTDTGISISVDSVRKILNEPSRYKPEVIDTAFVVIAEWNEKLEEQKEHIKLLAI